MKKIFEVNEKCQNCNGTGLYVGMCERDGYAVVCSTCNGTGNNHFKHEYEEFDKRIERDDITRVLKTNPGIMVGRTLELEEEPKSKRIEPININGKMMDIETGKELCHCELDFGGMAYKEWIQDLPFPEKSEMRNFVCPRWWYQGIKIEWKNVCDEEGLRLWGRSFSDCNKFKNKQSCWEIFDKVKGE